ncbi:MAG: bifunctional riboflavin kinase/FAD synthetase [Chloroflexi bacterium]|nr:bifunctional riboflavin kinase/FAD synthetase [Chloroflexota bacterium]
MNTNIEQELARHTPGKPTLLTIGVFDGVHLGHRHLLNHLITRAREKGCLTGVVTFKTHPEKVLNRRDTIPWICPLPERVRLLKAAGVDVVAPVTFTRELAGLTPKEFVMLLQKRLRMCDLLLGPDFALGKHRQGTPEYLQRLGEGLGFRVEVVKAARLHGEVISSSAIRQLLAQGDINKVESMLGRYFSLEGRVVTGDRRGRTLGFPTANLKVHPEQAMPKDGIYATVTHLGERAMASVTNIGVRPTFKGHKHLIETYIFDFNEDIYRRKIRVELVVRLRDEMRFNNIDELKTQMQKDVEKAKAILAKKVSSSRGAKRRSDLMRLPRCLPRLRLAASAHRNDMNTKSLRGTK